MAKTEVYLIAKKRNVKVDARLAPALVKMGRATYLTENIEEGGYSDKMMRAQGGKAVEAPAEAPAKKAGWKETLGIKKADDKTPLEENKGGNTDTANGEQTKEEKPAEEKTE